MAVPMATVSVRLLAGEGDAWATPARLVPRGPRLDAAACHCWAWLSLGLDLHDRSYPALLRAGGASSCSSSSCTIFSCMEVSPTMR